MSKDQASVKDDKKMESSEQETVSNEPVPETAVVTDTNVDVKDTTVENTSDESPPTGGVLSKKMEAREEHISDIDTKDREEEGGAPEKDTAIAEASESGQDAPRWMSSGVETYAIQCNTCFKWRIMPSKEHYEAIGEHILEQPFICTTAQEWRKDITCDDPADLDENEPTVLWAIDKHNIPCPPKGFYRKVVLRAENAKKFADIYYKAPCGKTLRSNVQVQKYLDEHPELDAKVSQFSFTSPKGKAEAMGAGVSSKRPIKDGTQSGTEPRKRMKGSIPNPELMRVKAPVDGQPPRPQPLSGNGTPVKSEKLSASKSNALRQDKPKLEKAHAPKSAPHRPLMAVKREKLETARGTR